MSISQAEKLKVELTDKWVVVADQVPELRRFAQLTGKVKTVNMNCRALVEFDGAEDISWYDIDPQFLTVVDGPRPKETKPAADKKPAAKKTAAASAKGGNPMDQIRGGGAPKAAAKPAAGGSPLDKIRSGGAAPAAKPAAGGSPLDQIRGGGAAPAAKPAASGSPLDQIRAQKAPSAPTEEEAAKPAEPKARPVAKPATGSPLDQIRAGGPAKSE